MIDNRVDGKRKMQLAEEPVFYDIPVCFGGLTFEDRANFRQAIEDIEARRNERIEKMETDRRRSFLERLTSIQQTYRKKLEEREETIKIQQEKIRKKKKEREMDLVVRKEEEVEKKNKRDLAAEKILQERKEKEERAIHELKEKATKEERDRRTRLAQAAQKKQASMISGLLKGQKELMTARLEGKGEQLEKYNLDEKSKRIMKEIQHGKQREEIAILKHREIMQHGLMQEKEAARARAEKRGIMFRANLEVYEGKRRGRE